MDDKHNDNDNTTIKRNKDAREGCGMRTRDKDKGRGQ